MKDLAHNQKAFSEDKRFNAGVYLHPTACCGLIELNAIGSLHPQDIQAILNSENLYTKGLALATVSDKENTPSFEQRLKDAGFTLFSEFYNPNSENMVRLYGKTIHQDLNSGNLSFDFLRPVEFEDEDDGYCDCAFCRDDD